MFRCTLPGWLGHAKGLKDRWAEQVSLVSADSRRCCFESISPSGPRRSPRGCHSECVSARMRVHVCLAVWGWMAPFRVGVRPCGLHWLLWREAGGPSWFREKSSLTSQGSLTVCQPTWLTKTHTHTHKITQCMVKGRLHTEKTLRIAHYSQCN